MRTRSKPSKMPNARPLVLALCALLAGPAHSLTPTASIGAALDFGDGIEYVPYEDATGYSILDPALEFGFVIHQKHRVSIQYMMNFYMDEIIFPHLTVVSNKFSAIYGYQFIPGAFIGPHCFVKFGRNEYEPYESTTPFENEYKGSLRDEYTYLGGGATLLMEPLKHFAIQLYTDFNLPIEHSRTNDIAQRMPESSSWRPDAMPLPSGKSSYFNMGVIFSAKF